MTYQIREIVEIKDRNPHGVFVRELAALYNAEELMAWALPIMAQVALSAELTSALERQHRETGHHIKRLEQVFDSLGEPIQSKECQAVNRLIDAGQEHMKESKSFSELNAAIVSIVQKVAHYEIAFYGTVCDQATKMGHDNAGDLLKATLQEKIATGAMLNKIDQGCYYRGDLDQWG